MWGVPVDHEMFEEISQTQWLWYFHNFIEDDNESFEVERDLVEYSASFIEPEAVKKIRINRDNNNDETIEVPEDEFEAGLKRMFGRALGDVTPGPQENTYEDHSNWLGMDLE